MQYLSDSQNQYADSIRKVAAGGIILFGGTVFAKLSGFIRQYIIIRMLSTEQYGLITLGLTIISLAAGLGNLGLYVGAQRYIAYYLALGNKEKIKGTIRSALIIITVAGMLIAILLTIFNKNICTWFEAPQLSRILLLYILMIPLAMHYQLMLSFLLGVHKAKIIVILDNIAFGIISVIFVFVSLILSKDAIAPVIALLFTYIAVYMLSIFSYKKMITPVIKNAKSSRITKELLLFSMPLFFSGISYIILNNTDTIMLGLYMHANSVAIYNASFLLMQMSAIFFNSFAMIFMPIISSMIAKNMYKDVRLLYKAVTKWIFWLSFPVIATFFIYSEAILSSLFSKQYSNGKMVLSILIAGEFINIIFGPNAQILIASGATKHLMINYIIVSITNISLNLALIPKIGMNGAAIATGISLAILNILNASVLYNKLKIQPFNKMFISTIIIGIIITGILYTPMKILIRQNSWYALANYPFVLSLSMIITLALKNYSVEDIMIIREVRNKISKRYNNTKY